MHTIPTNLAKALPHGVSVEDCTITTVAELGSEYDIDVADDIDAVIGAAPALLLPGWFANDGNAEVYFPDAEDGRAAAREYVESGDWGERDRTIWIYVKVYRKALGVGKDGDIVEIRIDEQWHRITFDPNEPACADGQTHDWRGRDVRGHGGGVLITEICVHCARYRIVDTWAQCRDTGEQGLEAIKYREPDESSREWVEARRLEAVADDLSDDYDVRFDREERRVVIAAGNIDDDAAYDAVDALEDRLGDDYFVSWSRGNDGNVRLYVSVA